MATKSISVHIVTWNSASHIDDLVRSLSAQTHRPEQCIVIDNGSTDDTVERMRQRLPDARIVENGRNEGFCKAHNQAIALSTCDGVLVLNPDMSLERTAIESMLRASARENLGSAGGKIYRAKTPENRFDSTGLVVKRNRQCLNRGEGEEDKGQYENTEEVFGISGACVFYNREALESIKIENEYFDEDFFAYKDDIDLAWRLRLAGWNNWYDPAIRSWHKRTVRASAQFFTQEQRHRRTFQNRLSYRNHWLMVLKNDRFPALWLPYPAFLGYEFMKFGYCVLYERSTLAAIPDTIRLAPAMRRKRRIAMSRNQCSYKNVERFFS